MWLRPENAQTATVSVDLRISLVVHVITRCQGPADFDKSKIAGTTLVPVLLLLLLSLRTHYL